MGWGAKLGFVITPGYNFSVADFVFVLLDTGGGPSGVDTTSTTSFLEIGAFGSFLGSAI